jgi:hypothetical protein
MSHHRPQLPCLSNLRLRKSAGIIAGFEKLQVFFGSFCESFLVSIWGAMGKGREALFQKGETKK